MPSAGLSTGEVLLVIMPHALSGAFCTGALSPDEAKRSERFTRADDRSRYLAAHALKRRVCATITGIPPCMLKFAVETAGKPFLPGYPLHFNLSHSRDWVAFIATYEDRVGVDIEAPDPSLSDVPEALVRHPEDHITSGSSADRFLATWTIKEAASKISGRGLAIPFASLQILTDSDGNIVVAQESTRYAAAHGTLKDGSHIAVATTRAWQHLTTVYIDGMSYKYGR